MMLTLFLTSLYITICVETKLVRSLELEIKAWRFLNPPREPYLLFQDLSRHSIWVILEYSEDSLMVSWFANSLKSTSSSFIFLILEENTFTSELSLAEGAGSGTFDSC
ncbi:hypothetical protein WICPIJ_008064 [Wickerhamomyces pijperi]|uniref:Uncharacterized protein n=1 Tax=Wickerhamomyces pijperi TaxID=599730 RepID=A0A9P8TJ83_WICPI|nr:hypothetical protein WICPIJ_008064 [Wickerhamomyces pijperi]